MIKTMVVVFLGIILLSLVIHGWRKVVDLYMDIRGQLWLEEKLRRDYERRQTERVNRQKEG